ncbi:MAG: copper-binding protein [Aquabacterium sp.]|uniref:copper-binding protein n=1 Tax=Aquabacterium sp. TaxID=1872578 RepID=UPI00271AC4D2|nr:copper-binding protein [Aquabacterium sp.]MDO9002572.1 copper-binding protein [Aquabacterium sp.]
MNTRHLIIQSIFASALSVAALTATAADHMAPGKGAAMAPTSSQATPTAASAAGGASAAVMADGVIRKIDKDNKKVTIKHGEIANLQMPGMTMVFQVRNAALLDKIQVGDKVKFHAEKQEGAIVVTDVQTAP